MKHSSRARHDSTTTSRSRHHVTRTDGSQPGRRRSSSGKEGDGGKQQQHKKQKKTRKPDDDNKHKSPPAPPPPVQKKSRVSLPELKECDDIKGWFDIAHELARPKLTTLERHVVGEDRHVWNVAIDMKDFLTNYIRNVHKVALDKGMGPIILFVSASTDRAVQAHHLFQRERGELLRGSTVAKLWSRHMVISDQANVLSTEIVTFATGAPNRMLKLAQEDKFPLTRLKYVVFDAIPDEKNFHLCSMPQVSAEWFEFWLSFIAPLPQGVIHVGLSG